MCTDWLLDKLLILLVRTAEVPVFAPLLVLISPEKNRES
jgi:hypothetical protein